MNRRRVRRPYVSIVRTAGQAKLTRTVSFVGMGDMSLDTHVVYETETERSQQSMKGGGTGLDKDGRRIEGNNVDCSRNRVSTLYKAD